MTIVVLVPATVAAVTVTAPENVSGFAPEMTRVLLLFGNVIALTREIPEAAARSVTPLIVNTPVPNALVAPTTMVPNAPPSPLAVAPLVMFRVSGRVRVLVAASASVPRPDTVTAPVAPDAVETTLAKVVVL